MKIIAPRLCAVTAAILCIFCSLSHAQPGGISCTSWQGVVLVTPEQPFLGGCWFMNHPGDGSMTLNWSVTSSSPINGPMLWPHFQGESLPEGNGDQYIDWDPNPDDCASHHVVITVQDTSGQSCTCDVTLVHLCPTDPPCVLNECGLCEHNGPCPEPPSTDDPPTCIPDVCGICNGDGSTCNGDPECILDACGICNGDGSSCNCVEINLDPFLIALDTNSLELKGLNDIALKHAKKIGCDVFSETQIGKRKERAADLANDNWLLANGIPRKDKSCGPTIQCTSIEVESNKELILKNSKTLLNMVKKTANLCDRDDKKFTQVVKRAKKLHAKNTELAKFIPSSVELCAERK